MPGLKRGEPRSDSGVLEVGALTSIMILSIVIAAALAAILGFSRTSAHASMETQAADAAQSVFELAAATPWSDLAHSTTDADLNDPLVQELKGTAPFVKSDPESFQAFEPTPAKVVGGTENYGTINDLFTVYTAVTWEDEPEISSVTGEYTDMFGTKRIDVLVVWGDNERSQQTFSTLRSPTIAEAVPSNVHVVAGGGLTVERDINAPVLTGDDKTGELSVDIKDAYKWELRISRNTDMSNSEVVASGEYNDIRSAVEDYLYQWSPTWGYTPSLQATVWTLDMDDSDASEDGTKKSNIVTFEGPTIDPLIGGKIAWNQDQIFWPLTEGLLGADSNPAYTVTSVITRNVAGQPAQTFAEPYNIAGDTKIFDSDPGESATYRVCTHVEGVSVACTNTLGPLYTVDVPIAPTVTDARISTNDPRQVTAEFTWYSNADSYVGEGGTGRKFDVQRYTTSTGQWTNLLMDTEEVGVALSPESLGGNQLEINTTIRVRVKNDAGVSPWREGTVAVGQLPPSPAGLAATPTSPHNTEVTWVSGSYASTIPRVFSNPHGWWEYQLSDGNGANWKPVRQVRETGDRVTVDVPESSAEASKIRVRGANYFGTSPWVTIDLPARLEPPGAVPGISTASGQGSVTLRWGATPGAATFEVAYRVNGTIHGNTPEAIACTSNSQGAGYWGGTVSWCNSDANTRSVTFSQYIREGDRFSARIRACNAAGCGPWSSWTADRFAGMRTVGNPGGLTAVPDLSGGRYSWNALTCDSGSVAEYRYTNTSWSEWGTTRAFTRSFDYGNVSGSQQVQQRCRNTTTGQTSTGPAVSRSVGWRLLPYVSTYAEYGNNTWNSNNWRRLEQELRRFSDGSGSNTCYSRHSDASAIHINGSTFGLGSNPVTGSRAGNASFWGETVVFQCWLNHNTFDGGKSPDLNLNNNSIRGRWGPETTNKLRQVLHHRCDIDSGVHKIIGINIAPSALTSTNAFDAYEMHRFTRCLNEGAFR